MTNKDPIQLIERHRQTLPVPIYQIIADFDLGFEFQPMPDNVSGWIERLSGGSFKIAVNASHPKTRQRFTAAHELGHYIYHKDLLGDGVGDNRAYRTEGTNRPNVNIRPIHERQANSFAANVLMPRHLLLKFADQLSIVELATKFEVSQEAMRIRLGR
jgi:hypothetical protein